MRGKHIGGDVLRALLSLSLIRNHGTILILDLLRAYKDPVRAMEVVRNGVKDPDGKLFLEAGDREVDKAMKVVIDKKIDLLSILDTEYPARLRHIYLPPPILFIHGDMEHLEKVSIAIVGTRCATPYGRNVARWLGSSLAREGVTVISGMAMGIDTEAHLGCLDAGGATVAVLGTGIDVPYPRKNRTLMERIIETGCVVSEFPPSMPGLPQNFPQRNRIVSGLSSGVVVVEAPIRSGALITARFALEQGKTVLAVPGEIWSEKSKGTHLLLRDGATPVLEVRDVIDTLGWEKGLLAGLEKSSPKREHDLSPGSSKLIACLDHKPLHIDEIAARCDLSTSVVLGELLKLEMKGLVTQEPGKYFNRRMG